MTISITKTRTSYAGSGSEGPFAVKDGDDGIYFDDASELVLTRIDSEGNETTLAYPADFSVDGAGSAAGSVTLADPLAVGQTLVIERDTARTQTFDPTLGGSFNPERVEAALDKHMRAVQDLATAQGQSLRLAVQDRGGSIVAVLPPAQAGYYVGWNGDGSGLANKAGADYSLSVGTVTTGAAGSSASAQIVPVSGTEAVLNLTIPRGNAGASGSGTGDLVAENNLSDVDDAPTALDNLGGQPKDDLLTSIAGLTFGANQFIYGTGTDTAAAATVTSFARTLLDDDDAATARTTLGLGTAATSASGDFAAASHNHSAAEITSGTMATARLGSGTASSSTYLRGDQTWATISAGNVQDVRLGALSETNTPEGGTYDVPTGNVLIGMALSDTRTVQRIRHRPLQKQVSSSWVTVSHA